MSRCQPSTIDVKFKAGIDRGHQLSMKYKEEGFDYFSDKQCALYVLVRGNDNRIDRS